MNETASSPVPPANGGAAPSVDSQFTDHDSPVSEAAILNGGIEIDVIKIDGSSEKVKVRQLPIALIGEWGNPLTQRNEAHLVELLCEKIDRATAHHLQNARLIELRLTELLTVAGIEQIDGIQARLTKIRQEIGALEAKPRWSDTITHESAARIRLLGEQLNKKKFAEQLERTTSSAARMLQEIAKEAPGPLSSNSSSSSPASAGSTTST